MSGPVRLEWAIVGWRKGDTFHVLASDQLVEGDVERVAEAVVDRERLLAGDPYVTMMPSAYYEIKARTRRDSSGGPPLIVMAQGESYVEAMQKLMDFWSPTPEEARAIVAESITPEAYAELARAVDHELEVDP